MSRAEEQITQSMSFEEIVKKLYYKAMRTNKSASHFNIHKNKDGDYICRHYQDPIPNDYKLLGNVESLFKHNK